MDGSDVKHQLHRRLSTAWSSPDVAALLESKPQMLSSILTVFRGLDQPVRLRVLLAFLALDEISVLPKEGVLAVLDEAAGDPDEWVKVVSALVRDWLFGDGSDQAARTRSPSAEVMADVLAKCGLLAPSTAAAEGASGDGRRPPGARVEPEPYFCPMEYLYLSEPVIQRHHRAAPLTRRRNAHFAVGDLREVAMEPIPDHGPLALDAASHQQQPDLGPSSSMGSAVSGGGMGMASSIAASASASAPAAASVARSRPAPPTSTASSASGSVLARPAGGSSLLGAAHRRPDKPRLKVIKLDDVKVKTDQAKVAANNEAVTQEFGMQPLRLPKEPAPKQQSQQQPPPPAPKPPVIRLATGPGPAPTEGKKRSAAAEGLAELLGQAQGAPARPPPPTGAEPPGPAAVPAGGVGGSMDMLSDYHKIKAKSNRLTPQDDERIRLFYTHGAAGNPNPQERQVKIKMNEEEVDKGDGTRVRETLYLTLNYDSRKAVLSRKVSKPKTTA